MASFAERHFARLIFGIWLFAAIAIALISREAILAWKMGDPDDQMRILQVRDWVAGQGWSDTLYIELVLFEIVIHKIYVKSFD